MPIDLRKKLFTSSDKTQFAEADMAAIEESLIREEVKRLNVRTLASCAGQTTSHTDAMAQTLFRLGTQHGS